METGMIFKKTSGIRYEIIDVTGSNITCRQLDGAGVGREIVFNLASINKNLETKKFKIVK